MLPGLCKALSLACAVVLFSGCSSDAAGGEDQDEEGLAEAPADAPLAFKTYAKVPGAHDSGALTFAEGRAYLTDKAIFEISFPANGDGAGAARELVPQRQFASNLLRIGSTFVYATVDPQCAYTATRTFVESWTIGGGCDVRLYGQATDGVALYLSRQKQGASTIQLSRVDVTSGESRNVADVAAIEPREDVPDPLVVSGKDLVVHGRDGFVIVPTDGRPARVLRAEPSDEILLASADYLYVNQVTRAGAAKLVAVPKAAKDMTARIVLGEQCHIPFVDRGRFYCDRGDKVDVLDERALARGQVDWQHRKIQGVPQGQGRLAAVADGRAFYDVVEMFSFFGRPAYSPPGMPTTTLLSAPLD